MTIRIYGASDGLVELEGCDAADEIGCYNQDVTLLIGFPEAREGKDACGLRVIMHYGTKDEAVWEARVSPLDEDVLCPWPVTVGFEGYSAVVEIGAAKDTPVTWTLSEAVES